MSDAFELIRESTLREIQSEAKVYRHKKTGAQVVSLTNADENKVFGITFKTIPEDSSGVAHILEHSVLCGSRKYRVKKPFVELVKGSLNTFLNAMTAADKTMYPVASQNLKDFYNLVEVYLDAVLFPLIAEDTFRQEGWHYEVDGDGLTYNGVVFNEMKGVYSSPDAVLHDVVRRAIYPETEYRHSSGGDPKDIPELSYDEFKAFHRKFYNPSNARVFFFGDDPPQKRLELLDAYFSQFEPAPVAPDIRPQPRFNAPRAVQATYAASPEQGPARDGMVTVNWLLDEPADRSVAIAYSLLSYVLAGTAAAPMAKALMDSGLGEGMAGGGIAGERQPMASFGLRGVDPANAPQVEALVLDTLTQLAQRGIDKDDIEAGINTFEFTMREANTGSAPRGLIWMFLALSNWHEGADPLAALAFSEALAEVKAKAKDGYLEELIRTLLLDNPHRVTATLSADPDQAERELAAEKAKLSDARARMSADDVAEIAETARKLKVLQETPDAPEELAKIPALGLSDLGRTLRVDPMEIGTLAGARVYFHNLPTTGILYLSLGFDLRALDLDLFPYLTLFNALLFESSTAREDYVALTQRIGRTTGGVMASPEIHNIKGSQRAGAWQFFSGKAIPDHIDDLLMILSDVILTAKLDDKNRFRQLALRARAGYEAFLSQGGNAIASALLTTFDNEAAWLGEKMSGLSYFDFIRGLVERVDADWPAIVAKLERIRAAVVNRTGMIVNVTTEGPIWETLRPKLETFLNSLPAFQARKPDWGFHRAPHSQGLTIPTQVNYVAKGGNLRALGYEPNGATDVALRHLNTTWLWDSVRVRGGAYGADAHIDHTSGMAIFSSFRDPNLLATLDAYDASGAALRHPVSEAELTRLIIGEIGVWDRPLFADAKGYYAMMRHLSGITDAYRQEQRDQVLSAGAADFRRLADGLDALAKAGHVVVMGSEGSIAAANAARNNFLRVRKVL